MNRRLGEIGLELAVLLRDGRLTREVYESAVRRAEALGADSIDCLFIHRAAASAGLVSLTELYPPVGERVRVL